MLDATTGDTEAETRDHAIVLTFYALGLRVSELCVLTLQETDLERGATWVKGKGRREKELIPLPAPVVVVIRRYLTFRGTAAGPLFQTRGTRGKARDGRLETRSVLRIVRTLGQRVGLHVWCHGLRHTSRFLRQTAVATTLIASLVLLGAPHGADPLHDPNSGFGVGTTSDISRQDVLTVASKTSGPATHCVACHASRSFRPRTQPRPLTAPIPQPTRVFQIDIFTASSAAPVEQPHLRAPPTSPSFA